MQTKIEAFADKDRSIERLYSMRLCSLPKRKTGQGSVEFIVILSMVLLALILIIIFNTDVMSSYSSKDDVTRGATILDTIESMGELVFIQGLGSQTSAMIRFPEEIDNITMSNSTVFITYKNNQQFHRNFQFNVSAGNLTYPNGRKELYARAFNHSVKYSFEEISYP